MLCVKLLQVQTPCTLCCDITKCRRYEVSSGRHWLAELSLMVEEMFLMKLLRQSLLISYFVKSKLDMQRYKIVMTGARLWGLIKIQVGS
jgi:hypothetical protein